MEFFLKHKTVILRSVGGFLLAVGFVSYFWTMPEKALSANDRAAANVARMEAKASGSSSTKAPAKKESSAFLDKLKKTQATQLKYLTITMMVFGVGFLGYSFIKKEEEEV